jgi:hypothetical protein
MIYYNSFHLKEEKLQRRGDPQKNLKKALTGES